TGRRHEPGGQQLRRADAFALVATPLGHVGGAGDELRHVAARGREWKERGPRQQRRIVGDLARQRQVTETLVVDDLPERTLGAAGRDDDVLLILERTELLQQALAHDQEARDGRERVAAAADYVEERAAEVELGQ